MADDNELVEYGEAADIAANDNCKKLLQFRGCISVDWRNVEYFFYMHGKSHGILILVRKLFLSITSLIRSSIVFGIMRIKLIK